MPEERSADGIPQTYYVGKHLMWAKFGSKLFEGWLLSLVTPAFAFGLAGGALAIHELRAWEGLRRRLAAATDFEIFFIVLGAVATGTLGSFFARNLAFPVLRLLEGYHWPWWMEPLNKVMRSRQKKRRDKHEKSIETAEGAAALILDWKLRWTPYREALLPTRLGNILRAAEDWPRTKHGLDPIVFWPHLWQLMPDTSRSELAAARQRLDSAALLFTWGGLFCACSTFFLLRSFVSGFSWFAIIAVVAGLLACWLAYEIALQSAIDFGQLVESVFDLYRGNLFKSLGWTLPDDPNEARKAGQELSKFIYRGEGSPVSSAAPENRRP